MDLDQCPVKIRTDFRVHEYAPLWHEVSAAQQEEFLETFAIDDESLKNWPAEIQLPDLNGLEKEIRYANDEFKEPIMLDIDPPQVNKPIMRDFSDCPICLQRIMQEEMDSTTDHRPVETTCSHAFGYSCLRDWSKKEWKCPRCRDDLSFSMMH